MRPLAKVQSGFAAALRDPEQPPPQEVDAARGGAARRFDVYRNNVVVGLLDALEDAFPVVAKLVGQDFFRHMARAYLAAEPPRSPVLLFYGRTFAAFIEGFAPARPVPYLADVARLEWARTRAHHAADVTPAPLQALAQVPQDEVAAVRLSLHPSLSLIRSRWPVASIWADCAGTPDVTVDMARPEDMAVLRPGRDVAVHRLPPGAFTFIESLGRGARLQEAAEAALAQDPDFSLSDHLAGLFELGAVAGLQDPSATAGTTPS